MMRIKSRKSSCSCLNDSVIHLKNVSFNFQEHLPYSVLVHYTDQFLGIIQVAKDLKTSLVQHLSEAERG